MKQEIERKFLLKDDSWKNLADVGVAYKQGFLISSIERTVRIRVAGDQGFITIKGPKSTGSIAHAEYEYEIPREDAEYLFEYLCEPGTIAKTRYNISYQNHTWEIDVFHGDNDGLVIAEVELESETEEVVLPSWVGDEVTSDERYINAVLAKNPYKNWK